MRDTKAALFEARDTDERHPSGPNWDWDSSEHRAKPGVSNNWRSDILGRDADLLKQAWKTQPSSNSMILFCKFRVHFSFFQRSMLPPKTMLWVNFWEKCSFRSRFPMSLRTRTLFERNGFVSQIQKEARVPASMTYHYTGVFVLKKWHFLVRIGNNETADVCSLRSWIQLFACLWLKDYKQISWKS
jgi:hypothetical protein